MSTIIRVYIAVLKHNQLQVELKGLGHAILGNFREFQYGSNGHRIN